MRRRAQPLSVNAFLMEAEDPPASRVGALDNAWRELVVHAGVKTLRHKSARGGKAGPGWLRDWTADAKSDALT